MTAAPTTFTVTPNPQVLDYSKLSAGEIYDTFDEGTPIFEREGQRYLLSYATLSDFVMLNNEGFADRIPQDKAPADLGYRYVGNLIL